MSLRSIATQLAAPCSASHDGLREPTIGLLSTAPGSIAVPCRPRFAPTNSLILA